MTTNGDGADTIAVLQEQLHSAMVLMACLVEQLGGVAQIGPDQILAMHDSLLIRADGVEDQFIKLVLQKKEPEA